MQNNEYNSKKITTYEGNLLDISNQVFNLGIDKIVLDDINTLNTVVASLSYHYSLKNDEKSLIVLSKICENNKVSLDIRLFIFWQLVRLNFAYKKFENINISKLYENISHSFKEKCKVNKVKINKERADNTIVLITNQYLDYEHAPTRVLMNIAKTINDKYKNIDKIYIYNSTEMPIKEYCNYYQPFIANYPNPYEEILNRNIKLANIDRCEVHYYQNEKEINTLNRLEKMLEEIISLNPKVIISIGGSNILADMCNDFIDVYTYGTTADMPIAKTKYLVNFSEEESIIENKINEEQYFIGIPKGFYGLDIKNENSFTRDSLNIPSDLFLISIVGNRLNLELTDEFIEMINKILINNKNTGIVIIGFYDESIIKNKIPEDMHKRIYSLGYIINLPEVLSLTNMYLNPKRIGGGYSCLYAMMCDIPILTIDYGDVATYLNDDFKVNDYEEMYKLTNTLIRDKVIYKDMCNKMEKIHKKYSEIDWHILIDYILKKLEGESK